MGREKKNPLIQWQTFGLSKSLDVVPTAVNLRLYITLTVFLGLDMQIFKSIEWHLYTLSFHFVFYTVGYVWVVSCASFSANILCFFDLIRTLHYLCTNYNLNNKGFSSSSNHSSTASANVLPYLSVKAHWVIFTMSPRSFCPTLSSIPQNLLCLKNIPKFHIWQYFPPWSTQDYYILHYAKSSITNSIYKNNWSSKKPGCTQ